MERLGNHLRGQGFDVRWADPPEDDPLEVVAAMADSDDFGHELQDWMDRNLTVESEPEEGEPEEDEESREAAEGPAPGGGTGPPPGTESEEGCPPSPAASTPIREPTPLDPTTEPASRDTSRARDRHSEPYSQEAEDSLVGGVLEEGADLFASLASIPERAFLQPSHRELWSTFRELLRAGETIDPVTVLDRLATDGGLERAGGTAGVANIMEGRAFSSRAFDRYAEIVMRRYQQREMVQAGHRLVAAARAGDENAMLEAQEAIRTQAVPGETAKGPIRLEAIGNFLQAEDEAAEYVVDGLLAAGGLSLLVSAPKVGKTTMARCLAVAVAQGREFLGRPVKQGPVIMLAMEDHPRELREILRRLGARETDPINVHVGPPRGNDVVAAFTRMAHKYKPSLIMVDTLQRLARVDDLNDYAKMTRALEPFLAVARDTEAHVMLLHHAKKEGGADGSEVLGSTAVFGTVDTLLTMRRKSGARTLGTMQRYTEDMPETILQMDPDTGWIETAGEQADVDRLRLQQAILDYVAEAGESTRKEIADNVPASTARVGPALNALVASGQLARSGAGRRGNPTRFSFPDDPGNE